MATVGKRGDANEPLTEHDVADRLDKAAVRLLKLLMEFRQLGMMDEIKHSRYHTNAMSILMSEMEAWGIEPEHPVTGSYPGK